MASAVSPIAATTRVEGRVWAGGRPISFAIIGVKNTTHGTQAAIDGTFTLEGLPPGEYTFIASSMGYRSAEITKDLQVDDVLVVNFELEERAIEIDGVAVTGSLTRTFVKESPTKINVVSSSYLEKIPTANVMDVIENVNGLYNQIDCGVCGTNNIRINGMDGPYTAVLIDGMPIMSSLATVYGLNGLSPAMIQQVEIIKGPMSTLYGSEAMGGVINVITKSAQTAPPLAINTFRTAYDEYALDVGASRNWGRWSGMASVTLFHNNVYHDENGDNFADLPLSTRTSFFTRAAHRDRAGRQNFEMSMRYYYEDRIGGTSEFIKDYSSARRGSPILYGETILTHRLEAISTWHLRPETGARIDMAFNYHDQDSFYGADSYRARQTTAFSQLLWPMRVDNRQTLMLGATLRAQRYDDNTGATGTFDAIGTMLGNRPDNRWIPGLFTQYEWLASDRLRLQTGLRIDYQEDHGWISSPSANLKISASETTTLRLNTGTGFRIVNLFTEDHAAYSGARATILLEDLAPERSLSGTASLQHIIDFDANPMTIDLEGFYTYFTNKIEPDYSQQGKIVYSNLDGSSTTRGLSLTLSQSMTIVPLTFTVGATVMDVFVEADGRKHPLEFAPEYQGVANATYRMPAELHLDYTMNLTGPMTLPEYDPPFSRARESRRFAVHNLQMTRDMSLRNGSLLQPYIALKNIANFTQDSPLVDPEHPFSNTFDTAYVYGPVQGRSIGIGLRWFKR